MKKIVRHVALAALAGCGIDNALVGGRCSDGFVLDGTTCVEIGAPPDVHVITPGDPPPSGDAGVVMSDASPPDATVEIDGSIVNPTDLPDATVDQPDAPKPLVCENALVACHGTCIPVANDGQNCGACGKICPSNICIKGVCQGATPGDVVLVGHDFTGAWNGSAQAKVLVNAVSIPTTDPIRVLSYEIGADAAAAAQARALVHAGIRREVSITNAGTADDLASTSLFLSYDVVILHDASGPDPATLGAKWSASLGAFTQKGGVVVALDGAGSQMPALLTATGLLQVGSHTVLPDGAHLLVSAPADVVGTQVLSPYAAFGKAVAFGGIPLADDTTWVIREDGGEAPPVVVHRVVR